jgi:flagellar biosynthetic protein FlhB
MAEESLQERTQAPTPKRRQDARNKGQVPRSQEVTTAFLLLSAAALLHVGGTSLSRSMAELFGLVTLQASAMPTGVQGLAGWLRGWGLHVMGAMAPFLLGMAGVALLVGAIQARGVLTVEPLKPQWSKLDPIQNIKRIWGVRAVAELAKSLLKLTIVSGAAYFALSRALDQIPALGQQGPFALLVVIRSSAVRLLASVGGAYLFLALGDYAFQLWQHERQLKMSREEIKREQKETEGDQIVKVRRRTMARQMARRRMMLSVSEADVVVTNPTHIAVALKYDPEKASAPVVLAMGARKVAKRIKKLAMDAGVPVVENKPLARALFAAGRVGFPIPVELYVAVAEVLAFVIRQRDKRAAWAGSGVA